MPYHNSPFGQVSRGLIDSPYTENHGETQPLPPPTTFFLVDNDGNYLIKLDAVTNDDIFLIKE